MENRPVASGMLCGRGDFDVRKGKRWTEEQLAKLKCLPPPQSLPEESPHAEEA